MIKEEVQSLDLIAPAIQIFDQVLSKRETASSYTIYELSKLVNSLSLPNEALYRIAFELSSLTLPVFSIIIQYEDEDGHDFTFVDREEIETIFFREEIAHPISGDLIHYNSYKDCILMIFRPNQTLFNEIILKNEQ
ncbi:MAG: hypothetical protein HYZ42_15010 [Bacteroidetes bacterium]|nr:hypothetical protein [Bacteroidota bacterium]